MILHRSTTLHPLRTPSLGKFAFCWLGRFASESRSVVVLPEPTLESFAACLAELAAAWPVPPTAPPSFALCTVASVSDSERGERSRVTHELLADGAIGLERTADLLADLRDLAALLKLAADAARVLELQHAS